MVLADGGTAKRNLRPPDDPRLFHVAPRIVRNES
jgi:hypothetical protein